MFAYSTLSSLKTGVILSISILVFGCSSRQSNEFENTVEHEVNPAAEGFNREESDSLAISWADAVMEAMGGRKAWDNTHYLSWDFFGRRQLWWDRNEGDVRIEVPGDSSIYLFNTNTGQGKVEIKGFEITNKDSLQTLLNQAKSIWINDSYWLIMPFKLKDSGVTLKFLRNDEILNNQEAAVLGLTFENVGDTPNNKYEVFITKADSLVKQWAYFKNADQDSASAIWPWDNYKNYNGIILSSDRSDGKGPHDVKVHKQLPNEVFSQFDLSDSIRSY